MVGVTEDDDERVGTYVALAQQLARMKYTVLTVDGSPRMGRRRWLAAYPGGDLAASLTFYQAEALIAESLPDPPVSMHAVEEGGVRFLTERAYHVRVWPERVGLEARSLIAEAWFPVEDGEEWAAAEMWLVDQLARVGWLLILPNRVVQSCGS